MRPFLSQQTAFADWGSRREWSADGSATRKLRAAEAAVSLSALRNDASGKAPSDDAATRSDAASEAFGGNEWLGVHRGHVSNHIVMTLQQTLIEPAERSRAIDETDLKDPVSNAPQFIEIAHGLRIFRRYPCEGLFAGNMRMSESR
jgi:hypothetical protein